MTDFPSAALDAMLTATPGEEPLLGLCEACGEPFEPPRPDGEKKWLAPIDASRETACLACGRTWIRPPGASDDGANRKRRNTD